MTVSLEEVGLHLTAKDDASRPVQKVRGEVRGLKQEADTTSRGLAGTTRASGDLTASLGGLHGGLTRVSGSMGDFAGRQVSRATLGLIGLTSAAVGFGIKAGAGFESSRISFGTLLEDVDAGNRLFSDLQTFNLKTPFQLGDLTNATQQLLAYGFAGQEAFGITKSITDVAAAAGPRAGEALGRIAFALGQIRSKGVQMEEVRQLQEAYFPALEILQEVTGKTGAELQDAMKKGLDPEITTRFLAIVESGQAKSLQKFRGGAEAQSKTLLGVWSNFRDQLNVTLADETSPLAQRLQAGLPELQKSLSGLLATGLPPLIDLLGDAVDAAPGFITEVAPMLGELVLFSRDFLPVLGDLVEVGRDLLPVIGAVADVFSTLLDLPLGSEVFAGLLVTLLGYRALSGVVGTVTAMAGALRGLAAAEVAVAAAGGAGGAAGAAGGAGAAARRARMLGLGAGGVAVAGYSLSQEQSLLGDLGTVGGFAATGAALGSVLPGPGNLIGGAVGGAVGGGIVLGRRLSGSEAPRAVTQTVAPGAIVVDARGQAPGETSDALLDALRRWQADQERRGG